ncbi:MAG TPA: glutaredoxin family protein [Anaerolineales bacterium]|jgi:glutaredoxin
MSSPDFYNQKPSRLVLYSAAWCPDCKRSKALLDSHGIDYLDIDIGKDNEAFIFVEKLTRRVRIPTIIFPDGTVLIEPSDEILSRQLGVA